MQERTKGLWPAALSAVILALLALLAGIADAEKSQPVFDRDNADLGQMEEGRKQSFNIRLKNISGRPLNILSVETSCGCTEASAENKSLAPLDETTITISIDTTAKFGDFLKVLDINTDISEEPFELLVRGNVVHSSKGSEQGAIFRGSCAECHMGRDLEIKSAGELYDSLCFICHKDSLPGSSVEHNSSVLRTVISNGLQGTSMPAFGLESSGPLSDVQVEALSEYLSGGRERQR